MPMVQRLVKEDVSLDTLNDELVQFAAQIREQERKFLYLSNQQGAEGTPISEGDFVVPTPHFMQLHPIQLETLILVVEEFPSIGLFLGAFHSNDGKVLTAMFPARQFTDKA